MLLLSRPGPALLALLALLACCRAPLAPSAPPPIEDPEPSGPPELQTYKEIYYRHLGERFVGHLTEAQLLEKIADARVLFLGDRHDDPRLHAWMLGLLAELRARGFPIVLGLESIGEQDEEFVQTFLRGDLALEDLRALLEHRYADSWLDSPHVDADFYSALLAFARTAHIPAFALEPIPRLDLWLRDEVIAANVWRAAEKRPDALIVVVVGQAHVLGPGRLMERVALPAVAVGARLSVSLQQELVAFESPPAAPYLLTDAGVVLLRP